MIRFVLGSIALSGTVLAFSSSAWAQTDEQRADARALATQGAQAFSEARWQDAVDLFERAESLVDAPTHLLFAARSHAKLHHYVKARELYQRIIRQHIGSDAPRAFRDAQTSAVLEIKDVEPHIGQLTIVLRGGDAKVTKVTMDGSVVQSILIGVARPVDPGEHQLQAEALGYTAEPKKVTVGDGASASVVLELVPGGTPAPDATSTASSPSSGPGAASSTSTTGPAQLDRGGESGSQGKRVGAYVAFGVGAVGLGAGTLFVLRSASKRAQADKKFEECGGATGCRNDNPLASQVASLDDSARSAKTLGIVGFVVGGVGVAAGVTLFASSGHKKPTTALSITPWIGWGSAGATGTF